MNIVTKFWLRRILVVFAVALGGFTSAQAAPWFRIDSPPMEIAVPSGVNHLPLRVPIIAGTNGLNLNGVTATSDATWVAPQIDVTGKKLILNFATTSLVTSSQTATITVTGGGGVETLTVKAGASNLNVVALAADPIRVRTYGLHQNGSGLGALVIFDPHQDTITGCLTLGKKPTDLAVKADGSELLAICSVSKTIHSVTLSGLTPGSTITLPLFENWGETETSAHVAYGGGSIIYYVDGAWGPVLHTFDRASNTVLQSIFFDGSAFNGTGNSAYGFGDIAISPDGQNLYGWAQSGWSAGSPGSQGGKFSIANDGRVTPAEVTPVPTGMTRDPLDTPVLIASSGTKVFLKQYAFSSSSVAAPVRSYASPIYAASPNAAVVSTKSGVYEFLTGNLLHKLPVESAVQAYASDYRSLVYFDSTARALKKIDLVAAIGSKKLGLEFSPVDGAIIEAPDQLKWMPINGIGTFHVYLGTNAAEVAAATPASALFLGTVADTALALNQAWSQGTTYYWRADPVISGEATPAAVQSFTISPIASSLTKIEAATIAAHDSHEVTVELSSATPGVSWSATSSRSWIKFAVDSGITPATLRVRLDATQLTAGVHTGSVTVSSSSGGGFTLPVKLQVDPLALTVIASDRGSTKVYAISEASQTGTATWAYLLEIDTLREKVVRVVGVGTSATDLAIHHADNRIYVPNWKPGGLLAINRTTFQVDQTFGTPALGGEARNDVYHVEAGGAGRLITESEDQWLTVSLRDTATGSVLSTSSTSLYEGGGSFEPSGRYYFHGEYGISSASLHKFDTAGDLMTEVTQAAIGGGSSRTVVITDSGNRIFWNGGVFDSDLKVSWLTPEEIYAASADGRYAFGETGIYDTVERRSVAAMPVKTKVSAFNAATQKLVVQEGAKLKFSSVVGNGLLGSALSPANGSVANQVTRLTWGAIPGVDAYRVYFGTNAGEVDEGTVGSTTYLGEITTSPFTLPAALSAGQTYYWRVDVVIAGQVVGKQTQQFSIQSVAPAEQSLTARTVQAFASTEVTTALNSTAPGVAWSVASAAPWISFTANSGTTPATLRVKLDATALSVGVHAATINITAPSGTYSLPVRLQVDPLNLTVMHSAKGWAKVYAISEEVVSSEVRPAYLLEIDTQTEQITRVSSVGTSATDLAIHQPDNRIYVTNWKTGGLHAISLDTLQIERTYPTPPYDSYGDYDAYRIAAGAAGRLMIEPMDQWVKIYLLDTNSGNTLASSFQREGGGQFSPAGNFYYHGDNNSSASLLRQFSMVGDAFTELKTAASAGGNYFGSRHVVVTEDGSRVFWNSTMYTDALATMWTMPDIIYSVSSDGKYAIGRTKIYDTVQRKHILGTPADTTVSAFNAASQKLVAQVGDRIAFFPLDAAFIAPALSATNIADKSITLSWTDSNLESGFTLQRRTAGAATWTDVTPAVSANTTTYTFSGLSPVTSYEFRIKADSPDRSSVWSNTLFVKTLSVAPSSLTAVKTLPVSVLLRWSLSIGLAHNSVILERASDVANDWAVVATLPAGTTQHKDTGLTPLISYRYRVKTVSSGESSAYSAAIRITTPAPDTVAPTAPSNLVAIRGNGSLVQLNWSSSMDNVGVVGYHVYRDGTQIGTASYNSYFDYGPLNPDTAYTYAVAAIDAQDNLSPRSSSVAVRTGIWGAQPRQVSNTAALVTALNDAAAYPNATFTITLASGTYTVGSVAWPALSGNNMTLQGPAEGPPAIIDGAKYAEGPVFTVTADNVEISGLQFVNVNRGAIEIKAGSENGVIADCSIESNGPYAAISGNSSSGWIIVGNTIEGVQGAQTIAQPAISLSSQSGSVYIVYNLVLNCDLAVRVQAVSSYYSSAFIMGNMIAENRLSGFFGASIEVLAVGQSFIDNNTVYQLGTYPNAIEYRDCALPLFIRNNLTNKPILAINSSTSTLLTNYTAAQASWFKDPAACDLRLASAVPAVVDQGTSISDQSFLDIEGDTRPSGARIDIGADEFVVSAPTPSAPTTTPSSGGGGGGSPSGAFLAALGVLSALRWFLKKKPVSAVSMM